MNKRLVLAAALAALIAGAVFGLLLAARDASQPRLATPSAGPYRGSEPQSLFRLPTFTLRDQNGKLVSSGDLRGKVLVVTFLDTDCKESCPVIASLVGSAIPRLSAAERRNVGVYAITVSPAADSPPKVVRFLRERGALGKLDFLLGSERELAPVWKAFKILSATESGSPDIHSAPVRVYDRRNVWVSTLHAGADLTAANLVHDLRLALRS